MDALDDGTYQLSASGRPSPEGLMGGLLPMSASYGVLFRNIPFSRNIRSFPDVSTDKHKCLMTIRRNELLGKVTMSVMCACILPGHPGTGRCPTVLVHRSSVVCCYLCLVRYAFKSALCCMLPCLSQAWCSPLHGLSASNAAFAHVRCQDSLCTCLP